MSYSLPVSKLRSRAMYVDLNSRFGMDTRGDLVFDREAITQAIYNIFLTSVGEAGPIFEPELGSMLPMLLQEPLDERTAFQIRGATIQALQRWEPRIEIDLSGTDVVVDDVQPGYHVTIVYRIRQTGEQAVSNLLLVPNGGLS